MNDNSSQRRSLWWVLALALTLVPVACADRPDAEPEAKSETAQPKTESQSLVIETNLTGDFLNAFKASNDCTGIQTLPFGNKADVRVYASFALAETPEMEEQWLWTVFDTRRDPDGEFRASGNEMNSAQAVRNMCGEIRKSLQTRPAGAP